MLDSPDLLSRPQANRTLLRNVRQVATPLFLAYQDLFSALVSSAGADRCRVWYDEHYAFYPAVTSSGSDLGIRLYATALLLNWIGGQVTSSLPSTADLVETEGWVLGDVSGSPSQALDQSCRISVIGRLQSLNYDERFIDILPYICEVFETSEELLQSFSSERKTKRIGGVFYTPSDVAEFLVKQTLSGRDVARGQLKNLTWLDPAVGTGCLLRAVLHEVFPTKNAASAQEKIEYVSQSLFGIDTSALALQSAVYNLVLNCYYKTPLPPSTLSRATNRVSKNFALTDATKVKSRSALTRLFSHLPHGVDCLISNPPYIRSAASDDGQADFLGEFKEQERSTHNIYVDFVTSLSELTNDRYGSGSVVVPLSLSYSTHNHVSRLRQRMLNTRGEWRLAHFDRTPDSLFGDDVKTRNTIVSFSRREPGLGVFYSTDLIRWNSRFRKKLFAGLNFARVQTLGPHHVIPKTGDDFGQELVRRLTVTRELRDWLVKADESGPCENLLRNASTAYNWLPIERVGPADVKALKYRYWRTERSEETAAIFALLHSRLTYWLWRVWGDGFHLSDRFILSLPFSRSIYASLVGNLKELGEALWTEMLKHKVISRNAGVVRTSYCPYTSPALLDQIDEIVVAVHVLPRNTITYLKGFISSTIVAGRDSEVDSNPALRRWAAAGGTR